MIKENIAITKRKLEKIKKFGIDDYQRKKYQELAKLLYQFEKNINVKILDVGCRSGHLFDELMKYGFHNFYGIDISPEAISYIKERGYNGEVLNIQEERLYLKFDIVIASHVIEHTNNPVKTIINLFTLLNKCGILYIEVPKENKINKKEAHFSYFSKIEDLKNFIGKENIIYEYDLGSLRLICE